MEAMDQRLTMADTDVEEVVDVGFQRKPRHQSSQTTKGNHGDGEQSENITYLDENGGALEDLNIHKIMSAIEHNASSTSNGKSKTTIVGREETRGRSEVIGEEVLKEEVVELEFEKVAPNHKPHTHTMHCPSCKAHITKVVIRRKILKPIEPPITGEPIESDEDAYGCLSCFNFFRPTENGGFIQFPLWGKPGSSSTGTQPGDENVMEVSHEEGNCFSIFEALCKPKVNVDGPQPEEPGEIDGSGVGRKPQETILDIPVASPPLSQDNQTQRQDSKSFEILKSIVYGGLMEVIASLSIVASADAADATTLSIVSLALANLIGGIFVIGNNLWDLRNDYYKTSNQQTLSKYKELLGEIRNFPLHVFFAILSFFVFGVIPPVAYGYAFHETNDKDFTLLVVAGVSMVCVGLLAIIKGYVNRCVGFWGYVKVIMYYLSTSIVVSGVSYGIGDLVTRVIEKLGLFEMTPGVDMSVIPYVVSTNTGLAYY